MNYVDFDIATVPDLFPDEPLDPTFKQAFQNLRKHQNNVYTIYSLENPEIYRDLDAVEDEEHPLSGA